MLNGRLASAYVRDAVHRRAAFHANPHGANGPRGSPDTDVRIAIPACNSAAATLDPDGTETR